MVNKIKGLFEIDKNSLSECNRVKRKTNVLSKDIKILFFCNIFLIFNYQM